MVRIDILDDAAHGDHDGTVPMDAPQTSNPQAFTAIKPDRPGSASRLPMFGTQFPLTGSLLSNANVALSSSDAFTTSTLDGGDDRKTGSRGLLLRAGTFAHRGPFHSEGKASKRMSGNLQFRTPVQHQPTMKLFPSLSEHLEPPAEQAASGSDAVSTYFS